MKTRVRNVASIAALIVAIAYGVATAASVPNASLSGRIENLETVADLIAYNQNNHVGLSIPGEGRIQRSTGMISRWGASDPRVRWFVHPRCERLLPHGARVDPDGTWVVDR